MSLNFELPELFVELKLMIDSSPRCYLIHNCQGYYFGHTLLAPKNVSFTLEKLPTVVIGKYVRQLPMGYAYLNSLVDVTKKEMIQGVGQEQLFDDNRLQRCKPPCK
jgi:hypothetical protein